MGETIMGDRKGLARVDWVVTLGCVTVALMLFGCLAESGRRHAKDAGCQANLRQWHGVFQGYIEENDGRLFREPSSSGWYWITSLKPEHKDWKRMGIWLCPQAATPAVGEDGTKSFAPSVFAAWGIQRGNDYGPNGMAGSYGLNGYVVNIHDEGTFEFGGGIPAEDGWRDLKNVPSPDRVPLFIDALRFDLWPKPTDGPATNESAEWSSNNMARCCINRHEGAVNCLFVDGSVRKVGLKELWTLKWHRSFDTAGPWTKAGGVQPENWPQWMHGFRDY